MVKAITVKDPNADPVLVLWKGRGPPRMGVSLVGWEPSGLGYQSVWQEYGEGCQGRSGSADRDR